MKIIFLDFDGVLNSAASFMRESKARKELTKGMSAHEKSELPPVNEHLDPTCASNFQYILKHSKDAKIVISSTWRELFDLEWLKKHLASYGIDSSRVIDRTPKIYRGFTGGPRGQEINEWLQTHEGVENFVVLDDNYIGDGLEELGKVVATSWYVGLTLHDAIKALDILGEPSGGLDIPV